MVEVPRSFVAPEAKAPSAHQESRAISSDSALSSELNHLHPALNRGPDATPKRLEQSRNQGATQSNPTTDSPNLGWSLSHDATSAAASSSTFAFPSWMAPIISKQAELPPPPAPGQAGQLDFSKDIYGLPQQDQQILDTLLKTNPSKISFTTPGQDAQTHTQPDYYLNAEGKLVKNPHAYPSKDGSIKIEVEGNNSAKKAEMYANKLQKEEVQYLINCFKHDYPNQKIPEMWQAIVDSQPDPSYSNNGDTQNNNTVTQEELQSYNQDKPAAPDIPPPDNHNPQTIPDGQPGAGAPTGPSEGSGSASSGGAPGGNYSAPDTQSNIPNQVTGNGGAPTGNLQQSSGTMDNYDGDQSHMSATQQKIVAEAEKDLGRAMWGGWSGANAVEGCAATVSQVLDNAGAANLHNAQDDNCNGLQADLLAQGWTITDKPQPGDVWIGRGGASSGHTGIVGANDTLLDNHSSDGLLSRDSGGFTKEWNHSVFLRPPDVKDSPQTGSS